MRQSAVDHHVAVERLRKLVVDRVRTAKPATGRAVERLHEWLDPLVYDSDPSFDADVACLRKHPEVLVEVAAQVADLAFELLELVDDPSTPPGKRSALECSRCRGTRGT